MTCATTTRTAGLRWLLIPLLAAMVLTAGEPDAPTARDLTPMTGRVVSVEGRTVRLAVDGDGQPQVGDVVEIGFEMFGETMLVEGDWRVSRVDAEVVEASAQPGAAGEPAPGHAVTIRPQATTTGTAVAAPEPEPADPEPAPALAVVPPPDVEPQADAFADAQAAFERGDFEAARRHAQAAADAGHMQATAMLGFLYLHGRGVAVDRERGMHLLETAARAGDGAAWYIIGTTYDDPQSTDRAKLAAMAHAYRQAAEAGNADGMLAYGTCLQFSRGVEGDLAAALAWYQRGAATDHPGCMRAVGRMYQNGLGTAQDPAKAMHWYRRAAAMGDAEAANGVAHFYAFGFGVERDMEIALSWYERAADLGHLEATKNIGFIYHEGIGVPQDLTKAATYYQTAARGGQVEAAYQLGRLYLEHPDMPDAETGLALMQAAGEADYPDALAYLGDMHATGRGVAQDDAQALAYFTRASQLGSALAYCRLGTFHRAGRGGLAADDRQAVACYRVAAQQDHPLGMYLYGWMLMSGHGVQQDRPGAIDWYRRAARLGQADAQAALQALDLAW